MTSWNGRVFVSTLPLTRPLDIKTLLASGAGLEIFAEGPQWRDPENGLNLTRTLLRGYNNPRSLHAPFYDLNLASEKYPPIRDLTLDIYKRFFGVAAELECEHVVIHTHAYTCPLYDPAGTRQRVKNILPLLAASARQAGIRLAVENIGLGPTQLFDSEEYVNLFREIDGIFALLDIGHAFLNGWDIPRVIWQLGEKLVALHLHDNRGHADEHLPIGMGSINWRLIREALALLPSPPALILEYNEETRLNRILTDIHELQCTHRFGSAMGQV
ncbi:sugar phosphate isomerase/epimerase family protein [Neomoorella thermoacetica]|uniref:Fructoselysine 3-epimerase n=2 Tax=Neomoorella thermoacetica TaxID=1525 RepID=A0AAC9HJC0_NEOTH|nr:sugar phosphate isomerase/epimerase [Moorella thermoacetica]AKX94180.1 fructoselysine 3-epimerase [Moorella thermoacetica]AKX96820.1 fructoselysine 3-epimerase [Moorella thermoacetica]AOQ24126.1 fructoselysine 3-epimerase [Moorella thermoacetica]OIQ54308.1 fructoselysine 3-epimerase [Moorella thermoacetica]OIQ57990.1 fructoselysine 3-epimerase [Moorella thermoacetica]